MNIGSSAEQKLAAVETEIARLRKHLDTRLSAIADELRRAEARDEWAAAQLREARRDIRAQNEMLKQIVSAANDDNR